MDLELENKVAIVTGGTQGIGKATAVLFAKEGACVVIAARGRERLDSVVNEIRSSGGRIASVQADVSRIEDCERLVMEANETFGRVDILVNNAGTSARGKFELLTDEIWQADIDVKLFAAIRLSRLVIPYMKRQGGGRIINITNIGAKQPHAGAMPTHVTRAAGLALTKALSKEFSSYNILVNTVCVGLVRAGQHERKAVRVGVPVEKLYTEWAKNIPLGRIGYAHEVASVIVFLASTAASYVTGTSVNVDGGTSAVL